MALFLILKMDEVEFCPAENLSKQYEPSSIIRSNFKRKDIAFKTDESGNPIVLFIGKENDNGYIKGERYVRTLKFEKDGSVMKDH